MDYQQLLTSVTNGSVIRHRVALSATSSDGIVYPPTYAAADKGAKHAHISYRSAWVDGEVKDVVVLDSPQSQSNRIELAILQASDAGRVAYPDIKIAFPPGLGEPEYSVLQLSHRIYDAVMRACDLGGEPFFKTDVGRSIVEARPSHATALFQHAPITLVLGAWDSNSGTGPRSAKFPRLLTSEIIALDARPAEVSATKFDPMDIRSNAAELVKSDDMVQRFTIKGEGASLDLS